MPKRDFVEKRHYGQVLLFAEDGLNIMIENGWMERTPQAPDRQELIEGKRG